jgi:MFS family permease
VRSGYLALLAAQQVRLVVPAAFVGRLPIGMAALALLLLIHQATGSYAVAGAATACFAIGEGLGQPVQGRLIDRLGQTRSLVASGVLFPGALVVLVLVAQDHEPPRLVLCAVALLSGVMLPPLMASMRALWPALVGQDELDRAYAMEAVIQELLGLIGPLLVAALVAVHSPSLAVLATGAVGGVGALWFAASRPSRTWKAAPRHGHRRGAVRASGVRTLLLGSVALGVGGGVLQVVLPAFATREGVPGAAGLLLAAVAVGSIFGGLWHGRRAAGSASRRYLVTLSGFAASLGLVAVAPSIPVLAVLAAVIGFSLAPTFAVGFALMDQVAPTGALTEAFAWSSTALVCGIAAGNAATGVLVETSSVATAALAGAAITGAVAAVTFLRRSSLAEEIASRRPATQAD